MPAVRVQFPAGPLGYRLVDGRGVRSPNKGPADWGSHPHSAVTDQTITNYGREPDTAGRAALLKRLPFIGHEGSNPSPSADFALVVKRTIIPRFERGVPGSNPGRGTSSRRNEG